MIGLCFHHEKCTHRRAAWVTLTDLLDLDRVYEVGTPDGWPDKNWIQVAAYGMALAEGHAVPVLIMPDNERYFPTPLPIFNHPKNALYIFGYDLDEPLAVRGVALRVYVPIGPVGASQAAALVLYDRLAKAWR